MAALASSFNYVYDVFPSFRGEDIRVTFLSHFLKELERKLISAFKDSEIEKSRSLGPELKQAIRDSRIAVVVFSKNYPSSSWCLNELLEIVKCKKESGQMVIPVFYDLDPSHVRKQTGDFGKIFEETCHNKTEELKNQWKRALTDVANIVGYHSVTWDNEAEMIEKIVDDVLDKLVLTPSKDSENLVGIENHIAEMSKLLQMESEEVRMVGIWGSSGIGKTTIARALFNRLSRCFKGTIFVDKAFIFNTTKIYGNANPDDANMKLHLQRNFLSEILGKKDIKIDHSDVLRERLKNKKVLIFIDDVVDHMVLDALVGQTQWFGSGSRIIVVTNDKQLLQAHDIYHIYKVRLPSKKLAIEMLCRYAFRQSYPPDGFEKLVVEVASRVGSLPLGLNVLGSSLRGKDHNYWTGMSRRLQSGLDGKIERTLKVSYDGLDREEDKAVFRHIACLFNYEQIYYIKFLLSDTDLDVNIALEILADKSLIDLRNGTVEMHRLLEQMGRDIVRKESIYEPGKREFLIDSKDICAVLTKNIGTEKVLGIKLDMYEIGELHIHENAFKGMCNLRFLEIGPKDVWLNEILNLTEKGGILHLPESFDYLPPRLILLCWPEYPMRCMPSTFNPECLVKLKMRESKLEKLWEGVVSLRCLKEIDLRGSKYLKEIPNLLMAVNLVELILGDCSSLVELPYSIRNLNKLQKLDMKQCSNLETLPVGINLKSLQSLSFEGCSRLKSFPEISTNIVELILGGCSSLVELPYSIRNLNKLQKLDMKQCSNLETLPVGINLKSLQSLSFEGCSRLKSFPEISTKISDLNLDQTGIENFPSNFHLENVYDFRMKDIKSEKLLEGVQSLTPLISILSSSMKYLTLSHIPYLVEIPSSIQSLTRLSSLEIIDCINLETLPTGIDLEFLSRIGLRGCSRLRTFPDFSTNIVSLDLSGTAIEEVPWWIKKLSKLDNLSMIGCSKLQRVSLHISELEYLKSVQFIGCMALTEASWNDSSRVVAMAPLVHNEASSSVLDNFIKCFEAQPVCKYYMTLSGVEVPSYFTHRPTGTSLTIPLLHPSPFQPFFKFKACAVLDPTPSPTFYAHCDISVSCRFKDRLGNHFDTVLRPHGFHNGMKKGIYLVIFDCFICLPERNYDHVDIQFDLTNRMSTVKLKGWGIRLVEHFSSAENQILNTLPHEETEKSRKRMRVSDVSNNSNPTTLGLDKTKAQPQPSPLGQLSQQEQRKKQRLYLQNKEKKC